METVLCVAGPTASGKTALAVELALALDGEIVSCDSMQIYRGMDIGTAKPRPEEKKGIVHHMIDVVDPDEDYSVSRYVEDASACVDDILRRGKVPIVAGGTGLYMDSLIQGLYFSNAPEDGILRDRLEKLYNRFGGNRLFRLLAAKDPTSAKKIHPNDRKRLCRALEVYYATKRTISEHNEQTKERPPRYRGIYIGLDYKDRNLLYHKINQRVDQMMAEGLADEVVRLLDRKYDHTTAMQAIGYKEVACAIRGGMPPDSTADEIKQATRHYAKRQLTWFRRNSAMIWFYRDELNDSAILRNSTQYFLGNKYNKVK